MKKATLVLLLLAFTSCIHPKVKFRKRALLDPMMDPAKTSDMTTSLSSEATNSIEKGSVSGDDGSLGSSCPTCG